MATFQIRSNSGTVARIQTAPKNVFRVTATHRGPKGPEGPAGPASIVPGPPGPEGPPGQGAYQDWLDQGNTGDFIAFQETIRGPEGDQGIQGPGVPVGGAPGQTIVKASFVDHDTVWSDPPASSSTDVDTYTYQRGVNLSGMEFTKDALPGIPGTDYTIHRNEDFAYFAGKGFTLVRMPFLWERLQPMLNGDLDPTYKGYIDSYIQYAKQNGMKLILEPHNYGRYKIGATEYVIGDGTLTVDHFADLWRRIASAYKTETGIFMYDLMNEPYNMPNPMSALTYNPDTSIIQLMSNPTVDLDTLGFNFDDPDYSHSADKSYQGTKSIKQVSTNGYGAFTTPGGIPVVANTDYTYSFYYQVQTAGNFNYETPNVQINTGDSFANGGVTLASAQLNDISTEWLRKTITFNSGNNTTVYVRHFNNNAAVTCYYDAFNMTPGTTAQAFTTKIGNGTVATTTLMNQAAINAIRSVDLNHWIAIEIDRYSGLQSFGLNFGTTTPEKWFTDPINKTMLSFHYYFDQDQSGTYAGAGATWDVAYRNRISAQVRPALDWARAEGLKVFIGEYGVPNDNSTDSQNFRIDMGLFMDIMDEYEAYGTHWAAGQWYGSVTTLHPEDAMFGGGDFSQDRAQMDVLVDHLGFDTAAIPTATSSAPFLDLAPDTESDLAVWANALPAGPKKTAADWLNARPLASFSGIEWDPLLTRVDGVVSRASADGKTAVVVLYSIPHRDGGGFSTGGADSVAEYNDWIAEASEKIGVASVIVILEPDATSQADLLNNDADRADRYGMLLGAVTTIKTNNPNAKVYIDAGNPSWIPADQQAERLKLAGIASADGFSINVSNFQSTEDNIGYGQEILAKLGSVGKDKGFVIDTSRNGNIVQEGTFNPPNRQFGHDPYYGPTGVSGLHGYLWIKGPGESDGASTYTAFDNTTQTAPAAGQIFDLYLWNPDVGYGVSSPDLGKGSGMLQRQPAQSLIPYNYDTILKKLLDDKADLVSPEFSGAPSVYNPTVPAWLKLQGNTDTFNYAGVELWNIAGTVKWQVSYDDAGNLKISHFVGGNWSAPFSVLADDTVSMGKLKVTGGTPGVGKVLTSDADGDATWATPTGGGGGGTGITRVVSNPTTPTTLAAAALTDYVANTTANLTLPVAAGNSNSYKIRNISAADITVTPNGTDTIAEAASFTIRPFDSWEFVSNNTNNWGAF